MNNAEFDQFADEYTSMHAESIRASGEGPAYFSEYKLRDVANHISSSRLAAKRVLDFGCGVGGSMPYFHKYLPESQLTGIDVSQRSIDIASSRFPDLADYLLFDGVSLPFADNTFDVVFTACVFHHIPANEHVHLLSEILRVLAPGGVFFVFEHNPSNPLTVRVVNQCPFDANAVLISASEFGKRASLAGFISIQRRYRIFFPHLLRKLRYIERLLTWCPLGAQYSLAARK